VFQQTEKACTIFSFQLMLALLSSVQTLMPTNTFTAWMMTGVTIVTLELSQKSFGDNWIGPLPPPMNFGLAMTNG